MLYGLIVKDYGTECQLTFYPVGQWSDYMLCDDYGVKLEHKEKWEDDEINPFDGELTHDWDEVQRKAAASLSSSFSRTKRKIYDLVRGQSWDWFLTFTFAPDKVDRYNFDECSAVMKKWLEMQRTRHLRTGLDLKYIVVPELHQDGAYHFHGIFGDADAGLFGLVSSVQDEYHVTSYTAGFSTATAVHDQGAVSSYIVKYITKDLCAVAKGKKRYWATKNLSGPVKYRVALRPARSGGSRLASIMRDLSPYVVHVSSSDGPTGTTTYIELKASLGDVAPLLAPYAERVELAQ